MKRYIALLIFCLPVYTNTLQLSRAILASDANQNYIQFWPIVAKAWKEIIGITPTLALIADADVEIDESLGDVIRFTPLPNIPTSLQAQVIRLLLPACFPDDGCIISDIDMIPLNKRYFLESISECADNAFIVYRDKGYKNGKRFPMCYNAAKGSTFQEIFSINSLEQIAEKIKAWHAKNLGWHTDELILTATVNDWAKKTKRCIKLGHTTEKRIDRSSWKYDKTLLKKGIYIDCHMPRPYEKYKHSIDTIITILSN